MLITHRRFSLVFLVSVHYRATLNSSFYIIKCFFFIKIYIYIIHISPISIIYP